MTTARDDGPVVVVDAENVRRSVWPNLEAGALVRLVDLWARNRDVRAVVVFDGSAPAGGGETTRVVESGAESADDRIEREASALAASGKTVWLVSSDRELRTRVGGAASDVIGGGAFVRELMRRKR